MRCDINLSLRKHGSSEFGTRTEIKNVNSFRFVERAIASEIERQSDILEDGGVIVQETRLYDAERDETRSMRSKEVANDYRYFPDPDLLPVELSDAYIAEIAATLPELPEAKKARFQAEYGLGDYDANALCDSQALAQYFERTAERGKDAKLAANWILTDLLGQLNASGATLQEAPIKPEQLGHLIERIKDNTLSSKMAKQVFEALWQGEAQGDVDQIIEARGLKQVSDSGALETLINEVVASNPDQVAQYRAADEGKRKKLIGFFVGQIMKASKGQANPQLVNQLLNKALS
jgi:aspartyl-tRNA(Asn)/glutamyl-tRNA(Gln) amidotransferase subunit B